MSSKSKAASERAARRSSRTAGKADSQNATSSRSSSRRESARSQRALIAQLAAEAEERGVEVEEAPKRVGDIRRESRRKEREERAQRARAKYRRYIMRILAVIGAVLVVVFGAIFIYRSPLLSVTNVQVEGTSHLTGQEITDIAQIPADATLLRLDTAGIAERLKGNAWVEDAQVHRVFPDSVMLTIQEREPGGVVKITDKKTWVISTDGKWLSAANKDDWNNGMRIVDVSSGLAAPVSGTDCNDGGIKNALDILKVISPTLKDQIKSISAESSVKTSLNLKSGVTVAFGDSNDVELKEAGIWALLEKYKDKISYINVRVPSNPTFRTSDN